MSQILRLATYGLGSFWCLWSCLYQGQWSDSLSCYLNKGFIPAQIEMESGELLPTLWHWHHELRHLCPGGQYCGSITSSIVLSCLCINPIATVSGGKYTAENYSSPIPEIIGLIAIEPHSVVPHPSLTSNEQDHCKKQQVTDASSPQTQEGDSLMGWGLSVTCEHLEFINTVL